MHLEDSLAMQCRLRSELRDTNLSLTEQRLLVNNLKIEKNELKFENLSLENDLKFTKLSCKIEEEAKRVESKKKCNWDHESHYASSEVHVVNNQRSERNKGAVKKSYLKREKG